MDKSTQIKEANKRTEIEKQNAEDKPIKDEKTTEKPVEEKKEEKKKFWKLTRRGQLA